mmetsp:Transcript_54821/g.91107  ORF Transcript_54821/g.91107 Transcript_54821/m.91107 type:complete len:152 (+) Transcript_54821:90-545(+)|eukprot:CAMPEP_0184652388 /NCGR_PEP_ID=MMETSP0308-20130426/10083_1 /TAXON_ID=38269 /ORGANISM="Gloeochaete witrockiana, Strain SAG 46.84" /LENGTH=151 /DNA_ID=CAMNT_0027087231 /DNA_START=80 /DNA_END=535 /DNA_ORIENTATION=-
MAALPICTPVPFFTFSQNTGSIFNKNAVSSPLVMKLKLPQLPSFDLPKLEVPDLSSLTDLLKPKDVEGGSVAAKSEDALFIDDPSIYGNRPDLEKSFKAAGGSKAAAPTGTRVFRRVGAGIVAPAATYGRPRRTPGPSLNPFRKIVSELKF